MLSAVSHCCVKANFIKAAKDNWVPCEVRLLTDDEDTFLCVKSRPLGFGQTEEDLKTIFSGVSDTGTILSTTQLASITPVTRAFTALCNLSEYKSCTVVTVSINDVGHFALKLVPAGIFGNKRLYLAMSNETEAASWMSLIKINLGKRKKAARNQLSQSQDSLVGTMRQPDKKDALRGELCTKVTNEFDLDINTIDNEVYEPCSAQDLIPAVIQQRGNWEKLHLSKMDCFLRLTDDRMELLDYNGERVLHWFPYLLIRRFGAVGGVLRLDAGRRCSTGDGHFFFACSPSNGQQVDAIVSQIRQLALEAKQRLRQEQASRQHLMQQSFSTDLGPSNSLGLLPPPVPSKGCFDSERSKTLSKPNLSPKGSPQVANNSGGCESGRGSIGDSNGGAWWSSGNFTSASSTLSRRQAEESQVNKEEEKFQESPIPNGTTSLSLKKFLEKSNGGFVASPGRAVIIDTNINGEVKATEPPRATSPTEVKDIMSNGNANQLGLYDNVHAPESEKTKNGGGAKVTQSWRLSRGSQPPRFNGKRLDSTDLPPAPPPPPTLSTTSSLLTHPYRDVNTGITNGLEHSNSRPEISSMYDTPVVDSAPPVIAPKPFVSCSPKAFDRTSYRQSSLEPRRSSWLAGVSNMRTYRPYREEALTEVAPSLLKDSKKSIPVKSLSFGSGVYESQEKCASDLGRLNMRGLDEVLQELRDANQNVTSAVQAAEWQRRAHGYTTPYHLQQSQSPQPSSLVRITNVAPTWSIKRDI